MKFHKIIQLTIYLCFSINQVICIFTDTYLTRLMTDTPNFSNELILSNHEIRILYRIISNNKMKNKKFMFT